MFPVKVFGGNGPKEKVFLGQNCFGQVQWFFKVVGQVHCSTVVVDLVSQNRGLAHIIPVASKKE